MTIAIERMLCIQGWAASVIVHGFAVTLAVLFVAQVKPLPLPEIFQWNVSLVKTPQEQPVESRVQAAQPPAPATLQPQVQGIQPVMPTPKVVTRQVQPKQPIPPIQLEQLQPLEVPKAIERTPVQAIAQPAVIQQRQEAVAQVSQSVKEATLLQETQQVERLPDTVIQSVAHVKESADTGPVALPVVASIPLQKTEPVAAARVEPQPVQTAMVPSESMAPQVSAEPAHPVTKAVQQAPAARADYGWLIESIGSRLAELKRYPATARLNGWEGKVLLRAVIRADGHLMEVRVQKSSGYEELDAAAMETMRQACPVQMRHELGRPEIVVNVPVAYALTK